MSGGGRSSRNAHLVWVAVVVAVLTVLHYDFWFWGDRSVVLGFMPIGLFYQAHNSLAAGFCWWLVVRCAWPTHIEEWANAADRVPVSRPEDE